MTDVAAPGVGAASARRLDEALAAIQSRGAPYLPDGESHHSGHASWTASSVPWAPVNGVTRYDATDFQGPASERELDACLAVMSTYDVPWRFCAWEHLGAPVLIEQLTRRGMAVLGSAPGMWRSLTTPPAPAAPLDGSPLRIRRHGSMGRRGVGLAVDAQVRRVDTEQEAQEWASVFTQACGMPCSLRDVAAGMARTPVARSLICHVHDRPAATLTLAIEDSILAVSNLTVAPQFRRQGLAELLLRTALQLAGASGATASVLVATGNRHPLYRRLGYTDVTRVTWLAF